MGSMLKTFFIKTCIVLSLLRSVGISVAQGQKNDKQPVKMLVLTERGGIHEGFVAAALHWLDDYALQHHITLTVVNHAAGFTEDSLKQYKVFIQLNYPPYMWSDSSKQTFARFMEQGRMGWVGFHHASLLGEFDGYPMWPWFSGFMGGIRFKNYIAAKATATVHVEDHRHPVMKGVPDSFSIAADEWYVFDKNPRQGVHVMANVDESSYEPPSDIKMGDHPVIWSNMSVKAKNVYFLMGHDSSLLQNKAFTTMFGNALLWAAE